MTGQSQGGRKLGPRKNTRGLETGKRQTQWSHCSPGRSEPAADFQDEEGNQNKPANREGKKGRRAYSGRQKAAIAGDEEALGRTQKEGLVKSVTNRVSLLGKKRSSSARLRIDGSSNKQAAIWPVASL